MIDCSCGKKYVGETSLKISTKVDDEEMMKNGTFLELLTTGKLVKRVSCGMKQICYILKLKGLSGRYGKHWKSSSGKRRNMINTVLI